jgi:hypothetical protein
MKTKLVFLCLMLVLLCAGTHSAYAFDLQDLLLNLYSKDGTQGITLEGGTITTGWAFPLDVTGTEINNLIQSEIANLSLNSSVASFSVEIDAITGLPLVTTEALGPIYAERAQTLGKGIFKFGASATYVKFTEFEGNDLDDLVFLIPHADFFPYGPLGDPAFELDQLQVTLDIEVEEYIVALFASYGILDNLDASVIVPFVDLDMKIDSHAELVLDDPGNSVFHAFDPVDGDRPDDSVDGDAQGIGDMIVRLKYFLRETEIADVAVAADLKIPTGDEKNLLGADAFTLTPFVILSKTLYDGRFNPHVNFGYEINFDDDEFSQLKYAVGFDSRITSKISFAAAVIGNNELSGDGIGDDLWDISTGLKYNPWRDLIFFANVQVPLNDEGLRADFVPSVGAEYSF